MSTANKLPAIKQDDFRLWAKTRLLQLRMSVKSLAGELGYQRNTVSIAINHPTMLPTVKRAIRKKLHEK